MGYPRSPQGVLTLTVHFASSVLGPSRVMKRKEKFEQVRRKVVGIRKLASYFYLLITVCR